MRRVKEIREYTFLNGLTIHVRLNRIAKTASFVNVDHHGSATKKDWVFIDRTFEYMEGWKAILNAMIFVIDDIKTEMVEWEKEDAAEFMQSFVNLAQIRDAKAKPKK